MAKGDFRLRASLWDRFHSKFRIDEITGCWLWTGAKKELGYGVIGLGHRTDGIIKAHRAAYKLYNGDIPDGMCVLHKCDTPSCVNPGHLFLGSLKDNARDCVSKGRAVLPDNRGERATWAKLKSSDVLQIKKREMSGPAYARMYGVSKSAIYEIWRGRNWSSI